MNLIEVITIDPIPPSPTIKFHGPNPLSLSYLFYFSWRKIFESERKRVLERQDPEEEEEEEVEKERWEEWREE